MSSISGIPQIQRPSLSGLTRINADSFTLGNVTITANSISGIDTVNFNNFTVSTSAIFNCPTQIYGNLIVSQNIINPNLSNANTEIFNQLSNLSNANVNGSIRITNLENANINAYTLITNLENANVNLQLGNASAHNQIQALQNANLNLQLGNASAHNQIQALQNANLNLQLGNTSAHIQLIALQNANLNIQAGNASAHTQLIALQNANLNIQLGNTSAHNQLIALQNANVNLQLGNASAHTQILALQQGNAQSNIRLTTLENKTQLLTSNATVSNIAGNLMISDTITIFGNANITNGMLVLPNNTLVLPNLTAVTGTTTSGNITVTASSFSGTEFPWYALQFNQPPATINTFSSAVTYDLSTGNYLGNVSTTLLTGTTYTGEWWQMYSTSPFIPYTININALFTSTAKEYYFLGSKTGTNGSWVLLQSSTTYSAGNLTMNNVSFPMNYLRIVCNKVQAGTNPARFYIAYITMTGGSGGNMRIDGYIMGDLKMYNGNLTASGNIESTLGTVTGTFGLVAGNATRVPTSQSAYMSWNYTGGGAETDFWTIQPSTSFSEAFRWYYRTLSPVTEGICMTLRKNGYLGLGTVSPAYPLDIIGQTTSSTYTNPSAGKYFSRNVAITNMGSVNTFNCSIHTTGSIWIDSLSGNSLDNSFVSGNSDKRIKENIKEINGKEALEKIRQLRPVYYDYIDRFENGLPNIGYIAQEVIEVVPQAVDATQKKFVPSVFTFGKWKDNLIKFDKPHGLKGEGKIQVVLQKHDKQDYLLEEKEEWDYKVVNGKVLSVSKESDTETKIFVYGEYVNDFHVLGEKFINIIAISALKEIDKRMTRLEKMKFA